jgi:polyhydroxybutyrate depolymerase
MPVLRWKVAMVLGAVLFGAAGCTSDETPPDMAPPDDAGSLHSPDAASPPYMEDARVGEPDAGSPHLGEPDAGSPDAGSPDAGSPDAGSPDPGEPDAGASDGGDDGSQSDAGEPDGGDDDGGHPDAGASDDDTEDAGVDDAGVDGPSPTCPGRTGSPGLEQRSVVVDGLTRTFLVYVPSHLDPEVPATVVFVHHGFTMSGEVMRTLTWLSDVADEEGFVVAFPDGGGLFPWHVGTGVCGAGAFANGTTNDIAFVEAMIEDIDASHCVAKDEVFVTGFSMGGYFSNHIACERPDLVRAIAPHSGGTYGGDCAGGPTPVMIVHGTADGLIEVGCGGEARDHWVERNGCSSQFDVVPILGGHCERHRDCPPGGQVTLCLLDGMAHGWSGGEGFYGGGTQYEDASWLIWDFFRDQR